MDRAYSLIEVKSLDGKKRVFSGWATTPEADRAMDTIDPMGAKFSNPLVLLHQHRHDSPIGTVTLKPPTKKGIEFVAEIPIISEPGPLKDRVDMAWGEISSGLVRAVSIGFRPVKHSYRQDGGIDFHEVEIYELSTVSVPANAEAVITAVKSIDRQALQAIKQFAGASSGQSGNTAPSVEGHPKPVSLVPKEGKTMKTYGEQIAALEAKRQATTGRLDEIQTKAMERGETKTAEEREEFNDLSEQITAIDAELKDLRALEKMAIATAKPVEGVKSIETGSNVRAGLAPVSVKKPVEKGIAFTRYVMALSAAKGNLMQAEQIAKRWEDTPDVATVIKAAVDAGTTTDAAWAAPLVEYQTMASEFAEYLRPNTIIGRIPGLRRVPFNIKVPRQTATSTAAWVGEGAPKPVSELAFDTITLGMTKIAGIVALTDELVRASNPAAEAIVRADLAASVIALMDRDFVDPAKAAAAGVSPASITNGVTPIAASGTTADDVRADVNALLKQFVTANMSLAGAVWIMNETTAINLAMMQKPLGDAEFPGLSIQGGTGGTFFGLPVVLSENIPANATVGDEGARIILAKASEILLADDGQVMIDVSREASLQMDNAPVTPVAETVMVSLWQHNLVGIRAERYINWAKRRPGAVGYIDSVNYGG